MSRIVQSSSGSIEKWATRYVVDWLAYTWLHYLPPAVLFQQSVQSDYYVVKCLTPFIDPVATKSPQDISTPPVLGRGAMVADSMGLVSGVAQGGRQKQISFHRARH